MQCFMFDFCIKKLKTDKIFILAIIIQFSYIFNLNSIMLVWYSTSS